MLTGITGIHHSLKVCFYDDWHNSCLALGIGFAAPAACQNEDLKQASLALDLLTRPENLLKVALYKSARYLNNAGFYFWVGLIKI